LHLAFIHLHRSRHFLLLPVFFSHTTAAHAFFLPWLPSSLWCRLSSRMSHASSSALLLPWMRSSSLRLAFPKLQRAHGSSREFDSPSPHGAPFWHGSRKPSSPRLLPSRPSSSPRRPGPFNYRPSLLGLLGRARPSLVGPPMLAGSSPMAPLFSRSVDRCTPVLGASTGSCCPSRAPSSSLTQPSPPTLSSPLAACFHLAAMAYCFLAAAPSKGQHPCFPLPVAQLLATEFPHRPATLALRGCSM
jgi:hypothetical protein